MPDKLTDNEIVKAWNEEIHLANYVNENYRNGIKVSLIENTLDLINRLQEKIKFAENINHLQMEELQSLKDKNNVLANELVNSQAEIEKYRHNNKTLVDGAMTHQKIFNSQQDEINRLRCIILSFMQEMYEWSNKNNIDTTNFSLIPILESEKESLVKQLKAEAYKEFAERLKEKAEYSGLINADIVYKCHIDNLLKELVGE